MRVNVLGLLRQSATALGRRNGLLAFSLEELGEHLAAVRDGKHTWDEFAEAYCLTERDRAKQEAV